MDATVFGGMMGDNKLVDCAADPLSTVVSASTVFIGLFVMGENEPHQQTDADQCDGAGNAR